MKYTYIITSIIFKVNSSNLQNSQEEHTKLTKMLEEVNSIDNIFLNYEHKILRDVLVLFCSRPATEK